MGYLQAGADERISATDIRIHMLLDLSWLIGWLEGKGIDPPPFIQDNYLYYKAELLGEDTNV